MSQNEKSNSHAREDYYHFVKRKSNNVYDRQNEIKKIMI